MVKNKIVYEGQELDQDHESRHWSHFIIETIKTKAIRSWELDRKLNVILIYTNLINQMSSWGQGLDIQGSPCSLHVQVVMQTNVRERKRFEKFFIVNHSRNFYEIKKSFQQVYCPT